MSIDRTKYEGHTPGPWEAWNLRSSYAHEVADSHWAIRSTPDGVGMRLVLATMVSDAIQTRSAEDVLETERANAALIADAPLLLDEIDRLTAERDAYRELHDGLSDMVEGGRLREGDIPDDYAWLVDRLIAISGSATP